MSISKTSGGKTWGGLAGASEILGLFDSRECLWSSLSDLLDKGLVGALEA